ncbi:hypothetical protein L1280_001729 [Deinococcus sp. HSC-46F16]|uniref:hypothetical protein n=1 Tax=Deinococcus sp. HSC-46F16 TaxID=2910968 RepID=UPI00209F3797|nr:hypothetical protein [Deinococcus sp. HSC-46F16]MCP2014578.1 hypothetical protein [Deinococcus sp. HSC-46F16]
MPQATAPRPVGAWEGGKRPHEAPGTQAGRPQQFALLRGRPRLLFPARPNGAPHECPGDPGFSAFDWPRLLFGADSSVLLELAARTGVIFLRPLLLRRMTGKRDPAQGALYAAPRASLWNLPGRFHPARPAQLAGERKGT